MKYTPISWALICNARWAAKSIAWAAARGPRERSAGCRSNDTDSSEPTRLTRAGRFISANMMRSWCSR